MLRRRLTFAPVLSLALCLIVGLLWVRSIWFFDSLDWDTRYGRMSVGSANGNVWWDNITSSGPLLFSRKPGYTSQRNAAASLPPALPPSTRFAGFGWTDYTFSVRPKPSIRIKDVRVPYWFLISLAAIRPGMRLFGKPPRRPGHCPACGYDLRATPGRCPECGTNKLSHAAAESVESI